MIVRVVTIMGLHCGSEIHEYIILKHQTLKKNSNFQSYNFSYKIVQVQLNTSTAPQWRLLKYADFFKVASPIIKLNITNVAQEKSYRRLVDHNRKCDLPCRSEYVVKKKLCYTLSCEYRVVRNRYSRLLFTREDRHPANLRLKEQLTNIPSKFNCVYVTILSRKIPSLATMAKWAIDDWFFLAKLCVTDEK